MRTDRIHGWIVDAQVTARKLDISIAHGGKIGSKIGRDANTVFLILGTASRLNL